MDLAGSIQAAARVAWENGQPAAAAVLDRFVIALGECRTGRGFRDAICGAYHVQPKSCRVRLCPDCERARSGRFVARMAELVGAMQRPVFWTLTIPNVKRGDLAAGNAVLIEAFRALRRRAIIAGGVCGAHGCGHPRHRAELAADCHCARCIGCRVCIHEAVRGGVYSVEDTWRPDRGDWHPHLHTLMDAPWIAWAELRDAWRAVTCDAIRKREAAAGAPKRLARCLHLADGRGIAIAPCRGASIVWVSAVRGDGDARLAAIRETLKYVSKGLLDRDGKIVASAGPPELAELLMAIRSRRLVAGWGTLRGVHDRDDEYGDDVLSGPDVRPEFRGLPKICPSCGSEAVWELPIAVPRWQCTPLPRGRLSWRPPSAARA
jgi:hypothetical protein